MGYLLTDIFDDFEGAFVSRLREISAISRPTADGRSTITFKLARIEAKYDPDTISKIEAGRLIAIPNVQGINNRNSFSVYEVADVYPMHYSMLTLDRTTPGPIRNEFMKLIEKEWEGSTQNTWIEIVGAPTGYIMQLEDVDRHDGSDDGVGGSSSSDEGKGQKKGKQKNDEVKEKEVKFVRKNLTPLIGSEIFLLGNEIIKKFICYTPSSSDDNDVVSKEKLENFSVGELLGLTDKKLPFTLNLEKLLHYHVGVFAFTGSGKSNLTSLVMRKAMKSLEDTKFVIFDVSSEYGINILDLLRDYQSRIVLTEPLNGKGLEEETEDYLTRHVIPEALLDSKKMLSDSVKEIISQSKIKVISIPSESEKILQSYSTYGGLMRSLADLTNEKFGASNQKILIPRIVEMIKKFMLEHKLTEESTFDLTTMPMVDKIMTYLGEFKLASNAAIFVLFYNLDKVLKNIETDNQISEQQNYDTIKLVNEILGNKKDSPKIFVINLPEADTARYFCAEVISRVFRIRKSTFSLKPRIVFVFDEAQEFIPAEKKKEDGTEVSSRTVERLLRHGRKYHLHGWISTQRIAYLNTNALQQLHSYFVSTMPRPYDRQLISDSFAIDDAFIERTLMFQNGDWLMTSFKATSTQNVPVFFHAYNNEEFILD